MLWEPLAVAALNQPIDQAAAAAFAAVLRPMFGRNPRNAALALPSRPLDEMYALPARAYIEAAGRRGSRVESRAPIRGHHVLDSERAADGGRPIICAVPWHALSDVLPEPPRGARPRARRRRSDGRVAHRHRQSLVRSRRDRSHAGRASRPDAAVGVRQASGLPARQASHLSLISSGAEAVVARSNQELIDLAMAEVSEALPAVRSASLLRGVVVREKKASFSVAPGQPRASAHQDRRARTVSRRRLDRHRPARYHRGGRDQRPLGRQAALETIRN